MIPMGTDIGLPLTYNTQYNKKKIFAKLKIKENKVGKKYWH